MISAAVPSPGSGDQVVSWNESVYISSYSRICPTTLVSSGLIVCNVVAGKLGLYCIISLKPCSWIANIKKKKTSANASHPEFLFFCFLMDLSFPVNFRGSSLDGYVK